MERAIEDRLKIRHEMLLEMVKDTKNKIELKIPIDINELTRLKLNFKSSIETFNKESYVYIEKSTQQTLDMKKLMETQLQAEEILVNLETTLALSQPSSYNNLNQTSRLPKLNLIKYKGDILKWPEFWDRFEATVDSKDLIDVEKLSYLMESLEGEAFETISGLCTTNENYKIAIKLLKERYGKKDKIIDAHYDALDKMVTAKNVSTECRRNLNNIEKHLRVLDSLGQDINNSHLRVLITKKFPEPVLYQVRLQALEDNNVEELRKSLEKVIMAMELSVGTSTPGAVIPQEISAGSSTEVLHIASQTNSTRFRRMKKEQVQNKMGKPWERKRKTSIREDTKIKRRRASKLCVFCQEEHFNDQCIKYSTVEKRKEMLKNRCFICFKEGHFTNKCPNKGSACFYCKKNHNRALCPVKFTDVSSKSRGDKESFKLKPEQTKNFLFNLKSCLQTAVTTLENNNIETKCRVLLDSGSQRSYLSTKLAKQLNLRMDSEDDLIIFTFGSDTPKQTSCPSTELILKTKRGVQRMIRVNIVQHITDRIPIPDWNGDDYPIDFLADDKTIGEGIDLLIGNDYYFSFIRNERILVGDDLYLINTDFGWIISGKYSYEDNQNTMSIITYCQCHETSCPYFTEPDLPLRTVDIKFLWALESIGITDSPKAVKEEEAVKYFNDTVKYNNGRYEVKWPWINYPPVLPTNFGLAYGRLKSLLQRTDKETHNIYQTILEEQLKLGIIEAIEPQEGDKTPIHYLPHHIVRQDGKIGRIVYDASAKCGGHKSLNECLYKGPSMIEDMTALLLQFRTGKIGITADVEKAFLQIGLQEADREVTRFLWIKDSSKELSYDNLLYYRFCRVPFGIISSPFLLTAAIRYHLSKTNNSLLKKIADRCYVDNLVTNADSISEAKEVFKDSMEAFKDLSMNIRDWTSNSEEFLATIPKHLIAKELNTVKVLGMIWDVKNDNLKLKLSKDVTESDVWNNVKTKRDVLRLMARFYDPCGFIAPLILPAKMLFQELCIRKLKWDSEMPDDLKEKWHDIITNLQETQHLDFARHVGSDKTHQTTDYELHAFTDASKYAYAVVVYLRALNKDGIKLSFLMSKARITPLEDKDDLKIPRLELLGYLIGHRLLKYINSNLGLVIQRSYLWTDSLVVLGWMKTNKLLPPFVSRRINEIKTDKTTEFRFVNGDLNPADLATRPELWNKKKELWLKGPTFLHLDPCKWPNNKQYDEQKAFLSVAEALEVIDGPEMVHKGYEIDFQNTHEDLEMEVDTPETTESIIEQIPSNLSEQTTNDNEEIKKLQSEYFPEEVAGKITHLTRNLGLFIDVDGILRCKGRMSNTNWTYEKKHPALIPRKCSFTTNIVKTIHEKNYHVGVPHTLSVVRQQFWIPQGRAEVESILRKCPQCVKHGGGPYRLPPTPDLPAERVNYNKPFTFTGIDYFGPIFVNTATGREKRWVSLFTCLSVRAIHLEIVRNLTASECLLALRRFTATRGIPFKIVSDNALQFKLISEVMSETYCKENGIRWRFIPQLAPWHGGFYERLNAIIKQCLKRTLEKHLLEDSHMLTVVKEIEAVVNTRPLVRLGNEPEHVLTPSDFLSLGQCIELDETSFNYDDSSTKVDLVKGWKRGQNILTEFKRMFQDQYLTSLRERYTHSLRQPRVKSHRQPNIGDLVQIKDDSHKNRNQWKVGNIVSLLKGNDGEIRVARVKVGNSEITRSIGHLYPLETEIDSAHSTEFINKEYSKPSEEQCPRNDVEIPIDEAHVRDDVQPSKQKQPMAQECFEEVIVTADKPQLSQGSENDQVNEPDFNDEVMDKRRTSETEQITSEDKTIENNKKYEKRAAAIRAREKIAEWTCQLFTTL